MLICCYAFLDLKIYVYVCSFFLHSSKSVTGNDYSDGLHMKKQAKDNTVLKVRMHGVPRIYEESPQIKAFAGLINLGALLWLKQAKTKQNKNSSSQYQGYRQNVFFEKKCYLKLLHNMKSTICFAVVTIARDLCQMWARKTLFGLSLKSRLVFAPLTQLCSAQGQGSKEAISFFLQAILIILLLLFLLSNTQSELFKVILCYILKRL